MSYWLDVILCGGMVALELLGIFIGAVLIQGIVYWTTGISIAKSIDKGLKKLEVYVDKNF